MPEIVLVVAAVVGLALFRRYAARQVVARRGRFVWAFAFPMVLGPAVLLWAGLKVLLATQWWGAFLVLFGVAVGSIELQFFRRTARVISNVPPEQDLGEALIEPTTQFAIAVTFGWLIVTILGGLALVVWAVLNQGR